jgi:putative restriction endonuclease
MSHPRSWTRDELLIAMNLYCKLPFGRFHDRTPEIAAVAKLLGRAPGGLSMKLCNLASFDPAHKARGVGGLKHVGRADRAIWDEFNEDWTRLGLESEILYQQLVAGADPLADEANVFHRRRTARQRITMPADWPTGDTQSKASVTVRRGQDFFRKAVLASYNCTCCITGNPIPELLNASHIKPWRGFPRERLNPANGLCLAKTHDAAFDGGLISFDTGGKLIVSRYVEDYLPSEAIERDFVAFRGRPLTLPAKFQPDPAFLDFHRSQVFRG